MQREEGREKALRRSFAAYFPFRIQPIFQNSSRPPKRPNLVSSVNGGNNSQMTPFCVLQREEGHEKALRRSFAAYFSFRIQPISQNSSRPPKSSSQVSSQSGKIILTPHFPSILTNLCRAAFLHSCTPWRAISSLLNHRSTQVAFREFFSSLRATFSSAYQGQEPPKSSSPSFLTVRNIILKTSSFGPS